MANLPESNEYPAGIYQVETTDPVLGGPPNEATKAGLTNIPAMQLAKRTNWLKTRVDQLLSTVIAASTLVAGIVRLSSATNSTSETMAATPKAVKDTWDNAETRALRTTTVTGSGLATGGGNLTADRVIDVPVATQPEAEAGTLNTRAMTPLRVMQAIAARLAARSVTGSGLAIGGGNLSADRNIFVPDATQAEAEAGNLTSKAMSPLRVAQAIAARLAARSVDTSGLAVGGGALSTNRTITVPSSTQAQAQAGTDHSTAMTPLRVSQALSNQYSQRSFAVNGYQVLPSGLILQWGFAESNGAGVATVLFPISFPGGCWNVSLTDLAATLAATHSVGVTNVTSQGFTAYVTGSGGAPGFSGLYFMAIGR